jgi:N-acetylglucosamine malate deacetylase 1
VTRPCRILVLAPHPDDEVVACGIAALRECAGGAIVRTLYLTTGVPPCELLWRRQRRAYESRLRRRREEAMAAAALLGLKPGAFLDIPARRLRHHLDAAAARVREALADGAAEALWVPAFEGGHQDHDAANAIAARFRDRLPVWEFAAYNFSGGRVRSNRFAEQCGSEKTIAATSEEMALKRRALSLYASERANLGHIAVGGETCRPLPRHDYGTPPHPGRLFRERFHWVPFRHPRVDFEPSAQVYRALGQFAAAASAAVCVTTAEKSR